MNNFKKDDVCVVLYKNHTIPLNIGDIVVVDIDNDLWGEIVIQVNKKEFVFIDPLFLKKIGTI